ncbi:MAG: alpha/beta hydrolase [Candidatus Rokuibacteriota bacterium]|nr:MAG: alpha/beta hydrolase [Candidatus Rokubacteria bacterium]
MRWRLLAFACVLSIGSFAQAGYAEVAQRVVDVPTRPGVTQRFVLLTPQQPKAAVVLFAGGHGGLQIQDNGSLRWGAGNFLVRSRQLFAEQDLAVAIVDAPSDRQNDPYLSGFRQTREHVADIRAVIAWLKEQARVPVWLIGTSRGTQSAAYLATQLTGPDGPDGIVLTSTILKDNRGRPVPEMELAKLKIPVLVVHHEQDGCRLCLFSDMPPLMQKLAPLPRKELVAFKGGESRGDPCEAFAHHGYSGLERQVVDRISGWILSR